MMLFVSSMARQASVNAPGDAGENFRDQAIGELRGGSISPRLPEMTWDFREQI